MIQRLLGEAMRFVTFTENSGNGCLVWPGCLDEVSMGESNPGLSGLRLHDVKWLGLRFSKCASSGTLLCLRLPRLECEKSQLTLFFQLPSINTLVMNMTDEVHY